jgi:hypothetical protein
MNSLKAVTIATLIGLSGAVQSFAQGTLAPLYLLINGGGSVSPLTNGAMLEVGQPYHMVAIPNAGFVFNSWQPLNVFTTTAFTIDPTTGNTNTVVSTLVSVVPAYTNQASLDFVMQPVVVIADTPGVRTITKSSGWRANFSPISLNIQLCEPAVVLTWTNSSCTLQGAVSVGGSYTNIPSAVSPYTNDVSAQARYFRLVSNQ